MRQADFVLMENYMLSCMKDSAHDKEHVSRVLYTALDIAEQEEPVDYDILIAACLLHDIGREEQYADPKCCHAAVGAEKAYCFLKEHGYSEEFAVRVASCIRTHRYRTELQPESIEAKILFDADKIDTTGTIGIARTILYQGIVGDPLYLLDKTGKISDGTEDEEPSFFHEYKYKLEKLYTKFYTQRGMEIAASRQKSAEQFYRNMVKEVKQSYLGKSSISKHLLSSRKLQ